MCGYVTRPSGAVRGCIEGVGVELPEARPVWVMGAHDRLPRTVVRHQKPDQK